MPIESVMLSNHLILWCPLLLFVFNLSQHQGLFQWAGSSHLGIKVLDSASASVLPMNIQDWFPLGLTGLIFLLTMGLSRVFSSTIWKHQFFRTESINTEKAQPSLWSNSHICTWLLEKPYLWLCGPLSTKWCLCFLICCHDCKLILWMIRQKYFLSVIVIFKVQYMRRDEKILKT